MWTRLLPDEQMYRKHAGADAIEGEWDRKDTVFPHAIRSTPPNRAFYDDFRRTPFADEVTLSAALAAMKAHELGQDDDTDVLAIGFSATDVIGHTYGPDSHESMDQLLRLDALLEKLFKEIDARVGLAHTVFVLSADHGALPLVENLAGSGIAARRASPMILEDAVRKALALRFPGVEGLIAYFATDIYFDDEVIRANRLDRAVVEHTAIAALLSTGLVEKVYTQADLMPPYAEDPVRRLFQNSFFQPRSPHLSVLVKKHVYLSSQLEEPGTERRTTTTARCRSCSWARRSSQEPTTQSAVRKTSPRPWLTCSDWPFRGNTTRGCFRRCSPSNSVSACGGSA